MQVRATLSGSPILIQAAIRLLAELGIPNARSKDEDKVEELNAVVNGKKFVYVQFDRNNWLALPNSEYPDDEIVNSYHLGSQWDEFVKGIDEMRKNVRILASQKAFMGPLQIGDKVTCIDWGRKKTPTNTAGTAYKKGVTYEVKGVENTRIKGISRVFVGLPGDSKNPRQYVHSNWIQRANATDTYTLLSDRMRKEVLPVGSVLRLPDNTYVTVDNYIYTNNSAFKNRKDEDVRFELFKDGVMEMDHLLFWHNENAKCCMADVSILDDDPVTIDEHTVIFDEQNQEVRVGCQTFSYDVIGPILAYHKALDPKTLERLYDKAVDSNSLLSTYF